MLRIQSSRTAPILIVIFSLLSAGLLLGCTGPSGDDDVLPDSVLALVLADLHLAGAELQFGALRDSLLLASIADGSEKASRDSVLEMHHLTEETFNQALEPYIEDPSRFVALYSRVLDRLNLQRQVLFQEVSELEER